LTQQTGIVVQKYGGSSVADVDKIARWPPAWFAPRPPAEGGRRGVGDGQDHQRADREAKQVSRRRRGAPAMLLTCGEREAMALLAMAVSARASSRSRSPARSRHRTNDRHSGARILEVGRSASRTSSIAARW
jgi:aspartokinase